LASNHDLQDALTRRDIGAVVQGVAAGFALPDDIHADAAMSVLMRQVPSWVDARTREWIAAFLREHAATAGLLAIRWMTVVEVAKALRVSKMTIYRLVHTGALASIKVGETIRIPEYAVAVYIRHQLADGLAEVGRSA
jgi:excisionase family DNA binding protein